MVRDQGGQAVVPARAPRVQPAVERVETGVMDGGCVPDVMQPGRRDQRRIGFRRGHYLTRPPAAHADADGGLVV